MPDPGDDLGASPPRVVIRPQPKDGNPWGVKAVAPQSGGWGVSATVPASNAPPAAPAAQPDSGGWVAKALEPITTYFPTQREHAREGMEGMKTGASEMGNALARKVGMQPKDDDAPGFFKGAFDTGLGALGYLSSPITAGLHTVVGKPIEENTGIPHEYTEFGVGLAIPGYGLARLPAAKTVGKTVEKILSPTTVGPKAQDAEALMRQSLGTATRETETTRAALEPFQKYVNGLPDADRLGLLGYIENRSKGWTLADKKLQPLADRLRDTFDARKAKLEAMPSTTGASFIEDYFPHMWKDQAKASEFLKAFGGRQGSGRNLRKRSIPTIEDGIQAGLEPISTDPVGMAMKYVENMDRFIATNNVFDTARSVGDIKYFRPGKQPEGWAELRGRLGEKLTPGGQQQAYAPEDWARIWNNYIGRGIGGENAEYREAYQVLQRGSNAITALELAFSGYHAMTMAQEGVVNEVARAVGQATKGKGIDAAKSLLGAPLAPVRLAMRGNKLEKVYLGTGTGNPLMEQVTDLLTKAGGRAKSFQQSVDIKNSAMGSYFTAWRKGSLKGELQEDLKTAQGAPVAGTAKVLARNMGRVMDTVMQPLFEKYIPKIKNGAFYENMADWLKQNPGASQAEQVAQARKIWDSIDNRFGELVQDNIFWNRTLKQSSMLAMRSYSWNLGTMREIGGGTVDLARSAIKGDELSNRALYVIALPIASSAMNAMYQYLKTGEGPKDMHDLQAPRTGGTDAATGEPERAMLPGYMKDVYGWWHNPVQEAKNKMATGPRLATELVSTMDGQGGSNWRGDPILSPPEEDTAWTKNVPRWLYEYFAHIAENVGPISMRQVAQGRKDGSGFNKFEDMMGIRSAGRALTDPDGYDLMMQRIRKGKFDRKQKFDARQKQQYGGAGE